MNYNTSFEKKQGREAQERHRRENNQIAKPHFEHQPFDVTWANKKGGISAVGAIWGQKEK
jgi:hypothetical protein